MSRFIVKRTTLEGREHVFSILARDAAHAEFMASKRFPLQKIEVAA